MKKIGIVIPRGAVMPDAVLSAYFLFTQVNLYFQNLANLSRTDYRKGRSTEEGGREAQPFKLFLLSHKNNCELYGEHFLVRSQKYKTFHESLDLIIVPGFTSEMESPLEMNQELVQWLKAQYENSNGKTELASMCTGAFLIAATGLLEGRCCTTHWAFQESFIAYFPLVNLQPDSIVTDDNGIYTSGGAYSSLNLILYLIEKFCGKETAVWAAKIFQIDHHRKSQKPFIIFNQQKSHADQAIIQIQNYLEQHFQESMSIQSLATQFNFSRRNLVRRFKKATGNTPIEYLQRVRIESAKRDLEYSAKNINEIIYDCGYNDGNSFRKLFKKYTGFLPSTYRKKYAQ